MNSSNIESLIELAKELYNFNVGGEENVLLDFSEDSKEYKSAKAFLDDPQLVYQSVYGELKEELERPQYKNLKFEGIEAIRSSVMICMIQDGYDTQDIKF
ncbi:hypothetical protein [Eubacterium sp.]|uniref:hypothetical protein n=1 Tax=Eubacterium sp. TaxID=142586 RepID=UPI002FCBCFE9